jgi:ribosomal protein S18 acetylase RimI-like enzyme
VFRKFQASDAESASEMLLSAFDWFHKGDKNSWLFRSFAASSLIENSRTLDILVAADDGKYPSAIVGYISSSNSLYGSAYIPTVAVHPSCQRKGLGQRLVECKLEALRKQGMRKAWLLVTSTNTPAITFYLKNNFVIEGYLRNHTGQGKDEILFSKFL